MSLLCLLLVPALKRLSASSCPWDLREFGGGSRLRAALAAGVHDGGPGHCFPSGHAVAAFAFLRMYFGWRGHAAARGARWCLAGVCAAGALFGWAQLARGAHFASHTLWSAWLCWVVCTIAAPLPSAADAPTGTRAPARAPAHSGRGRAASQQSNL